MKWHTLVEYLKTIIFRQQPPIEDLEYGRVSAEEYSEAIEKLLSGAGIKLDMEKQCLLQKTLCLQEQLSGSQAALLLEQVSIF